MTAKFSVWFVLWTKISGVRACSLGLPTKKIYSVLTQLALATKYDYDNTREIKKKKSVQMNVFNSMFSSRPVEERETACNKTGDSFCRSGCWDCAGRSQWSNMSVAAFTSLSRCAVLASRSSTGPVVCWQSRTLIKCWWATVVGCSLYRWSRLAQTNTWT